MCIHIYTYTKMFFISWDAKWEWETTGKGQRARDHRDQDTFCTQRLFWHFKLDCSEFSTPVPVFCAMSNERNSAYEQHLWRKKRAGLGSAQRPPCATGVTWAGAPTNEILSRMTKVEFRSLDPNRTFEGLLFLPRVPWTSIGGCRGSLVSLSSLKH